MSPAPHAGTPSNPTAIKSQRAIPFVIDLRRAPTSADSSRGKRLGSSVQPAPYRSNGTLVGYAVGTTFTLVRSLIAYTRQWDDARGLTEVGAPCRFHVHVATAVHGVDHIRTVAERFGLDIVKSELATCRDTGLRARSAPHY